MRYRQILHKIGCRERLQRLNLPTLEVGAERLCSRDRMRAAIGPECEFFKASGGDDR